MSTDALNLTLPGEAAPTATGVGSVYFVGTATTLIRLEQFTILTDPNFLHAGEHVHLGYGLIAERKTDPAIDVEQLPPLDFCLLSHMHGDHWDRVASDKLRKDLPIITTPSAVARLKAEGFNAAMGLKTWQGMDVIKGDGPRLRVISMPGKHGPGPMNLLLPKVMGSMIEVRDGDKVRFRMYVSGDTLLHDDLPKIPQMFDGIDLVLIHLGGTRAFGILVTMDAEQGVKFLRIIHPDEAIPIHYDDYSVFKSPLEDFVKAANAANLPTKITYLNRGEKYDFPIPAA
jgi:L-ascorbate metabolism protein UlaG (beta-lactamase superfamily)